MVLPVAWLRIEVKPPATYTRLPTTSMSQISPSLISGMLVRGMSGTIRVCPGAGSLAVVTAVPVLVAVWVPSLTVMVKVRVPTVA